MNLLRAFATSKQAYTAGIRPSGASMSLITELKRRNVFRVAAVYIATGWLLVQLGDILFETFHSPEWVMQSFTALIALGFPFAVILAWAFELTPEGVKRDSEVTERSADLRHGQRDWLLIGIIVVAVGFYAVDRFFLDGPPSSEAIVASTELADNTAVQVDVSVPVPGFSNRAAVAVLPFENHSGDPDQDYFADGITDDVITSLQIDGTVPVIARTSTYGYKGTATDPRTISADLGVGYILQGTVRKAKDRVRITVQLVDSQGLEIWAQSYDRQLEDIFAVQDDIARHIVGTVAPTILESEMRLASRVRTQDMEAWDYYLQGFARTTTFSGYADIYGRPITLETNQLAKDLVEKAIELDPDFALAYTLLGHLNVNYSLGLRPYVTQEFARAKLYEALEYARKGYELSPFAASTCSCYAYILVMTGDLEAALRLQEDGVKNNPANAFAHAILAMIYEQFQRHEEALKEIRIATRLSPRDMDLSFFRSIEAENLLAIGKYEEALEVARHAMHLTSQNFDAYVLMATALYALDRRDDAREVIADLEDKIPGFTPDMLRPGVMPKSLETIVADMPASTDDADYQDAIRLIFTDLGWQEPAHKSLTAEAEQKQ
jgi:TolB-like protein